ncbi:MAG: beta-ketoacyl synthase N-terminal-like domain-containing protein [Chloroflexi bacterium]|nr:beta-ketoacyl synthase N-terminal-like domain-containing protein [Chloroflexota bacterium]
MSPFGVGVPALLAALDGESAPGDEDPRWGGTITSRRGVVPGFRTRLLPDRKAVKVMSRDAQLAVVAAMEACGGLDPAGRLGLAPERFGAFGAAGYEAAELADVLDMMLAARDPEDPTRLSVERLYGPGRAEYHPLAPLKTLPNMALFHVGIALGLRGPQLALGSSAAAGIAALGEALEAVAWDEADAAVVVATDSMTGLSRIEAMVEAGLLPGTTWPAEGAAGILIGAPSPDCARVLAWEVGQEPVENDEPSVSYGHSADDGEFIAAQAARVLEAARAAGGTGEVRDISVESAIGYSGAAAGLLAVVLAVHATKQGGMARVLARGLAGDVAALVVGRP